MRVLVGLPIFLLIYCSQYSQPWVLLVQLGLHLYIVLRLRSLARHR